jgi:hypothetical protein
MPLRPAGVHCLTQRDRPHACQDPDRPESIHTASGGTGRTPTQLGGVVIHCRTTADAPAAESSHFDSGAQGRRRRTTTGVVPGLLPRCYPGA